MTQLFEPRDGVAEWRKVYDLLRKHGIGETITYEQLGEALGRDFLTDRAPIYRAMRQLERDDHRTLINVRNAGYRIAEPREHEALARGHHRRSRRQLGKAVGKAASADRTKLTPEERKRIDGLELTLRQHAGMIRRLDERSQRQAEEIKKLRREKDEDVAGLSERVDRLAELLERHGVKAVDD